MNNVLRCIEYVNQQEVSLSEIARSGMNPHVFLDIAKRCGYRVIVRKRNNQKFVKLKKNGIPIVCLYDGQDSKRFNYVDISDLHVGHPDFSADILDDCLGRFYKNGKPTVDYVFIAGDLFEGLRVEEYLNLSNFVFPSVVKDVLDIRKKQVKMVCKVLSKYDFDYHVINGNHEYTFDQLGCGKVCRDVESYMRSQNRRFTFYDTYIVDFIIGGVTKRMMHLESYNVRKGANHAVDRLAEFKCNGGLKPRYNEMPYPIRMFQCGHIHTHEEIYDSANKVYISQSGSFIKSEMRYLPYIHMKGIVLDDTRILRD